jgi:hypothetical protein
VFFDFLILKFGTNRQKVEDFTIKAFTVIYKEPYKSEDIKKRIDKLEKEVDEVKNSGKNSVLDLDGVKSSLKDIRDLTTSEKVFEKVVDLITKFTKK